MIMKKSYNSSDEEILPELLLPKFSSLAASDDSGMLFYTYIYQM